MVASYVFLNFIGMVLWATAVILFSFRNSPNKEISNELNTAFPLDLFLPWKTLNRESPVIRKTQVKDIQELKEFLKNKRFHLNYRAYSQLLILERALVRFEQNLNIEHCWVENENIYKLNKEEIVKDFKHKKTYKTKLYLIPDYIDEMNRDADELEKEYKILLILLSNSFVFSLSY